MVGMINWVNTEIKNDQTVITNNYNSAPNFVKICLWFLKFLILPTDTKEIKSNR